jgi:hypothetical protein
MKKRSRIIYFGFIAVLMLSEMVTSNVYSLLGPLEDTAELMGVSESLERIRLIILSVLDAIPGVAAVIVILAYRSGDASGVGRFAVILTTFGMLAYGGYQFWSATFQLGNMQNFVRLVGVVYSVFGIIAWFVGGDLRQGLSSPNQSMKAPASQAGMH